MHEVIPPPGIKGADDRLADLVAAGLSRITGQRIALGPDGANCTVYGLVHRLPATQPVSLGTALALRKRGIRTVVVQER